MGIPERLLSCWLWLSDPRMSIASDVQVTRCVISIVITYLSYRTWYNVRYVVWVMQACDPQSTWLKGVR